MFDEVSFRTLNVWKLNDPHFARHFEDYYATSKYTNLTEYCSEKGHLEFLKCAHMNGCPWGSRTCTLAAENGYLECLKYAHENECPWNGWVCSYAAGNGHLACFMVICT